MVYLTKRQALHAMTEFLENLYWIPSLKDKDDPLSNVGTDNICTILSGINTTVWLDRGTADPASWYDWLDSIDESLKELKETETNEEKISIKVSFVALRKFIHKFYSYSTTAEDVLIVLYDTRFFEGELVNEEIWNKYLQAVNIVLMDTHRYT